MPKVHKYWALFSLSFMQGARNIKVLIGLSIFLLTCLIIFAHIWHVATHHSEKARFAPELLLWYIAFNQWVLVASQDVNLEIQEELQTGSLAYSMVRPISYLGAKFTESFGRLCAQLLFLGAVTFVFTALWTGCVPFSPLEGAVMVLFGFFAGALALIFQMVVGITCFWLQDSRPVSWVFEKLLFVFGGLLLPLACYPEWLQTVAHYTPFSIILGARSALVLDCSFEQIAFIAVAFLAWILVGLICLKALFASGMKILTVQGG